MTESADRGGDAVVVPAIATGSSLASVRSLGRRGVKPIAVGDPSAPACHSKYCHEVHAAPPPAQDPDGYVATLLSVARRPEVVTVVPLREADVYLLAKHRDRFADHVATPWPAFETVRASQDWLRLLEVANEAGVPTPPTRPLDEYDRWDRPTVVKSRYSILEGEDGLFSPGVRFVPPGDPPDVEGLVSEMGHVPVAQEYVPGDAEHGFFALYDRGERRSTFQHRRIRSYTYAGGASVYREATAIPELGAAGTKMLDAFDWHGPAMVEFKRDPRDDSFRLMEINPRFWGSLPLAVHAGVDFPYLYYRLATGRPVPVPDYEVGLACHLLRGEASYLHSVLRYDNELVESPPLARETLSVLASLVRQPHFDQLSLDDPRPFAADLLATLRKDLPALLRGG